MKYCLSILVIFCMSHCTAQKAIVQQDTTPACILQKIDSIKSQPQWNPPATIEEYNYKGKKVYLLSAPCCDFFITAVDENCNPICSPSGGITGKGDGKCPGFASEATLVKVVWKDER